MKEVSKFGGEPGESDLIYPPSRRTPELSDIVSLALLLSGVLYTRQLISLEC